MVVAEALQHDDHEGHHRLHQAELQSGLLAEPQESDSVCFAHQAARAVHTV